MPPKFSLELKNAVICSENIAFQHRTSPCETYCPAGNPIQKLNRLVHEKRFEDALLYVRARNPFPGICGRICPHPCEQQCNRNNYDESVSIRALERSASDYADMTLYKRPRRREKTGRTIAVIGSGPAGLTAAYFLALFGHTVTIFEAASSLGGMPRICVPDYRLPKDVVDREVGQILELGVQARTNTIIGKDISFAEIRENHDACLIAVGTWREKNLDVPGIDNAIQGLSFLRQVASGNRNTIGEKAVIIGGGGVAFDCAFTARRLGAREVNIVCLESKDCMVAHPEDIVQGETENILLHNSKMISKVVAGNGKVQGIEYYDVDSFQFDESGNLNIVPISDGTHLLSADTVILAIGEVPSLEFLGNDNVMKLTGKGTISVDASTMSATASGVFAAGDVVSGPTSVATAIGSGRCAAISIDRYLTDSTSSKQKTIYMDSNRQIVTQEEPVLKTESLEPHVVAFDELLHVDYFDSKPRTSNTKIETNRAIPGFEEILPGYSQEGASDEASRCFHCGHCFQCGSCVDDCPGYVLTMGDDGPVVSYPDECWHCGNCRISCPCGAVSYDFPLSMLV